MVVFAWVWLCAAVISGQTIEQSTLAEFTSSTASAFLAGVAVNSQIVFAGGSDSIGSDTSDVTVFDVNTRTFSSLSLSDPRANLAAASVQNIAVFAVSYSALLCPVPSAMFVSVPL